jgi:hypothetical protein
MITTQDHALLETFLAQHSEDKFFPTDSDTPRWLVRATARDIGHRIEARLAGRGLPCSELDVNRLRAFVQRVDTNALDLVGYDMLVLEELVTNLNPAQRAELQNILKRDHVLWLPQAGPQDQAYNIKATLIGYGGSVGSGKTSLAVGLALTKHREVLFMRRIGTELQHIFDQTEHLLGDRKGFNSNDRIWRVEDGQQIVFGSCPTLGDEKSYQGRPRDLLVLDETTHFLEPQVSFVCTWLRTTTPGQECRILLPFNPPDTPDALWLYDWFAPWLSPDYRGRRARSGELRWFIRDRKGKQVEVEQTEPFYYEDRRVFPQSRTFIAGDLRDNRFLPESYMAVVQQNPDSDLLLGDFTASSLFKDHPQQLFPGEAIECAMAKGKNKDPEDRGECQWYGYKSRVEMQALGLDVAYGGADRTVGMSRYSGRVFGKPKVVEGKHTPDGKSAARVAMAMVRDGAPINVDGIGYGAATVEALKFYKQNVHSINVALPATGLRDNTDTFEFVNMRSYYLWRLREWAIAGDLVLPFDADLRREMLSVRYVERGKRIYVEGRADIIKRLGRSPDILSALMLASIDRPKVFVCGEKKKPVMGEGYDPYAFMKGGQ